jgi:hypothetical protein
MASQVVISEATLPLARRAGRDGDKLACNDEPWGHQ